MINFGNIANWSFLLANNDLIGVNRIEKHGHRTKTHLLS